MVNFPLSPGFFEVDHTADIAFFVCGESLEDLFLQSLLALKELAGVQKDRMIKDEQREIYKASTKESLMITFLNEILFFLEKEEWPEPLSLRMQNGQLHFHFQMYECQMKGVSIKAVTYNMMDIVQQDELFSTMIVFDV